MVLVWSIEQAHPVGAVQGLATKVTGRWKVILPSCLEAVSGLLERNRPRCIATVRDADRPESAPADS
jgi:hypothetical protein